MTDVGLVWGGGSILIRMSKADEGTPRLCLDADRDRFAALMSVVGDRLVAPGALAHLEAADRFWQRGDKALANLRLMFADLPRLATLSDAYRLTLATHLLDEGMSPNALTKELGLEFASEALKYAPYQARIPAGHGRQSGQFTFGHETAAASAARIVLASEEDSAAENKDAITDQSNSGPSLHKPGPPHHSTFLTPLSLPPPPPMLPRVGGAGGESEPAPKQPPPHDQPPLLQPGPPPPNSQPLPPGIGPGKYANGWVPAVPGKRPDPPRQRAINQLGELYGYHICGMKDPGTSSGNFGEIIRTQPH